LSSVVNRNAFNSSKQEQLKSVANLRFFACLSQTVTCAVSNLAHRGQRSEESIEFRKEDSYALGKANLTLIKTLERYILIKKGLCG
jgi:O-phosphoseryl-tRNA(Cys) synthetase